jgi:hypothetical protein
MNKKKAIIAIVVVIVLAIAGYFGYTQYAKSPAAQQAKAQKEIADTVSAVGRLITLPEGDTPQVAVVTDLAPLSGQPFFRNAAVGDRVVIYPNIGRAILYNPKLDKIIEIATLQYTPQTGGTTDLTPATTAPKTN